jgi:hypothetical protein
METCTSNPKKVASACHELDPRKLQKLRNATYRKLKAASILLGLARLQLELGSVKPAQEELELVHDQIQRLSRSLRTKFVKIGPAPV